MTTTANSLHEQRATADDELAFAGLTRLAKLLQQGHLTPRELTEFYLRRIDTLNPTLAAFISTRGEEALAEADAALDRLRAGERGPLLGIPIAIKDNVDIAGETTADGTGANTTPAAADSEVVRRLRSAGAPIIGRTALPELAMWGHMTESQTNGVTRNPWRFQAAAAPPERVSDSLTNEVRCGDAEGSLSDRGCEGRDLGATRGGGERGRDQSPARYAEADGEQVPAADGRGPAEATPSGGVLPDLG